MEFLTTIYGFGSILAVCVSVVVLAVLGFKVKATRDGFTAARDQLNKTEPLMPERYARFAVQLVEAAVSHMKKMGEFWPRCLERQMAIYEEQERGVISLLVQDCSGLLEPLKLSAEMQDSELSRWRAHVCNAMQEVKDHVRSSFRNNHYWEMDSQEWERYIEGKERILVLMVSDHLDRFWASAVIPRAVLRTIGDESAVEFKKVIRDVLARARALSIRTKEEEVEEAARYASHVSLVTGLPYPEFCK